MSDALWTLIIAAFLTWHHFVVSPLRSNFRHGLFALLCCFSNRAFWCASLKILAEKRHGVPRLKAKFSEEVTLKQRLPFSLVLACSMSDVLWTVTCDLNESATVWVTKQEPRGVNPVVKIKNRKIKLRMWRRVDLSVWWRYVESLCSGFQILVPKNA